MTLTQSQSDTIRDIIARDAETNPRLREAIARELRRMGAAIPVPADAKERTWSKLEGLQKNSEPVVLEAAMGGTPSPYPQNAGSTGAIILSGLTAQTPCLAAGPRDKSDGCPVAGLMGGN